MTTEGELTGIRAELHGLSAKLDTFIGSHEAVHTALEAQRLDYRLRQVEDTLREWTAYARLLKWVFGTSLIGAITGTLALLELLFRS